MNKMWFILLLMILVACIPQYLPQEDVKLAKCLTEKGVVEYGAFWCPNCAKQRKMFGAGYEFINYIECDPKGDNSQTELCLEKKVQKYPDWEFPDGTRLVGVQDFETLAATAGCDIPLRK